MTSKLHLLPLNESKELKALDVAYRSAIPNHVVAINFDPMTCDVKLLPYLAQCWQVLYWDEQWNETEKRRFVRDARDVHKHIGTHYALKKMFEALDIGARVVEWYEFGGEPYTFNIDLSLEAREITPEIGNRLRKYVEVYKNVRTQLNDISLAYLTKTAVYLGCGAVTEVKSISEPLTDYRVESRTNIFVYTGAVSEIRNLSKPLFEGSF